MGEVVPDLSGLWSCATLGKPRWWSRPVGGFVLTCLIFSWVLGFMAPVLLLAFLWLGWIRLATTFILLVSYQYVVRVAPWPLAAKFWLLGTHWFGGCSMIYEEREPNDLSVPTMNCYFPHGIFTLGIILNSGIRSWATLPDGPDGLEWEAFVGRAGPVVRIGLAASSLVHSPIFGHVVAKWTGCIRSAAKGPMTAMMRRGESFGLLPGGFHEAAHTKYGKDRVVVSNKKGFIKYALQYGYKVVPAYSFGECYTYYNLQGLHGLRAWLAEQALPGIVVRGWLPLPWLPFPTPWGIHTVHGSGRQFPKIDVPTDEDVRVHHELFVADLRALFDRHKWRFGLEKAELEVL